MSGTIELPSGTWSEFKRPRRAPADEKVCPVTVRLELEGVRGSLMFLTVHESEGGDVDLSALHDWAKHPDSRIIVLDGETIEFFYDDRPEPELDFGGGDSKATYAVTFSCASKNGRARLPPGLGLGEVSDQQLLDIVSL